MVRLVKIRRSETRRHASGYHVTVTKRRWLCDETNTLMKRHVTDECLMMRTRCVKVFVRKKDIIVHQKDGKRRLKQILQLIKKKDGQRIFKQMVQFVKKKQREKKLKQMVQLVTKNQLVVEKKRKRRLKQMLQFVFVPQSITYDMIFFRKIWCQIMINKYYCYPANNDCVGFCPLKLKYAQIPGFHTLVGYTYRDLYREFVMFSGRKNFTENDSELLEYFLFCKLYCAVCAFQVYDFHCVINSSSNYVLKLRSIFTSLELSFQNLFVMMCVPGLHKSCVDQNVCVGIFLSSSDCRFMAEAKWVMKAAQTRKFGWMNKIPSQIRPSTCEELFSDAFRYFPKCQVLNVLKRYRMTDRDLSQYV